MVVQHNLTAMNSNRMLGATTKTQAKSTEKLSSGYKINRAADDAAGLSISEKMRKQVRGLTQASANAQDGISTVQTAEGALAEVHDMLQRMNELAVKASNGTMSENDRSYVQNEIDQLVTEIDRVSTTTKFNETYLLQGDGSGKVGNADITFVEAGATLTIKANTEIKAGDITLGTVGANIKAGATNANASVSTNSLSGDLLAALNKAASGEVVVARVAGSDSLDKWTIGGTGEYSMAQLKTMGLNVAAADDGTGASSVTVTKEWVANKKLPQGAAVTGTPTAAQLKDMEIGSALKATVKVDADGVATVGKYDATYVPDALKLDLHVGADSSADNKINLSIESMSSKGLGLVDSTGKLKIDGEDSTNADAAIDTIAAAIQKVSMQRSDLGAVQNRLEHTISNLDNVVENTTAAESQIRDTDMATEMVKYSNNNILSQAGQAMLAQANQSNQGVLSLLG